MVFQLQPRGPAPQCSVLALIFMVLGICASSAPSLAAELSLTHQSFANSPAENRLRTQGRWQSTSETSQLSWRLFLETSALGDRSIEFPEAYQVSSTETSEWWWGRRVPWYDHEYDPTRHGALPVWSDARAMAWVQNQTEVFDPLVLGWVGWGYRRQDWGLEGARFAGAFSPVFLPSFGPTLRLSADHPAEASRYGRLPPGAVRVGDATLPIRYRIATGDLAKILLQPQVYLEWSWHGWGIQTWSAPSPDPEAVPDAEIRLAEQDSTVLVSVTPRFDRQIYSGLSWRDSKWRFQSLYEWKSNGALASISWLPIPDLAATALSRWSPSLPWGMSGGLLWKRSQSQTRPFVEWRNDFDLLASQWRWLDTSMRVGIEQQLSLRVSGFASAQWISAAESAPLTPWRSLDLVQAGMRAVW